jgi:predicted nucleotidyltransferase
MKNTIINKKVIQKVAHALGELNEEVIYVGGAVVSLYINDVAAEDVRPTKDIDISLSVATINELEDFREKLTFKGFLQSFELNVICRFKLEDILVDVMNVNPISWTPANPWFKKGFENLEKIKIEESTIQIMPLNYFLASKFSAYEDRGGNDPRFSHDIEDITYILDNRMDWEKILTNEKDNIVKNYIMEKLLSIKRGTKFQEAILGNLFYETAEERLQLILDKIDFVLNQ